MNIFKDPIWSFWGWKYKSRIKPTLYSVEMSAQNIQLSKSYKNRITDWALSKSNWTIEITCHSWLVPCVGQPACHGKTGFPVICRHADTSTTNNTVDDRLF